MIVAEAPIVEVASHAGNYSELELRSMGIQCGSNILVHRTVQFFGDNIVLGSNVRIDCFCVITSGERVLIGDNVHVGAYSCLFGAAGITICDFAGISARCSLFSTSDDYSGGHLTNPTVPSIYRKVTAMPIRLERHALIGASCVVMPGVTIHKGAAVGALSFVNKNIPEFIIATGNPIRKIGQRNRKELERLEELYENEKRHN
jgi:acetyltransferase-like isoleucine patch superfamily enzyme